MIGQKHYVITNGHATSPMYWRGRRNQSDATGWSSSLMDCRSYRRPDDALRAARQLEVDPGTTLEVMEVGCALARVCYRVETHALIGVDL